MSSGWLFLRDGGCDGTRCAVPLSSVHKILKEEDQEFKGALGHAETVVPGTESVQGTHPGAIIVMTNGGLWAVRSVELDNPEGSMAYMAVSPGLLKAAPPWCRGVLWAAGKTPYFVVNTDALNPNPAIQMAKGR